MCGWRGGGLPRRTFLVGLGSAALAACSENEASGRRQLAFVPEAQLIQMADQGWAQLRAETPLAADPVLNARLARVAQPLAAAAGRPDLDWEFVVFDRPELNAFVLPNGKVGVFRGMMEFAREDDELGAVVGHEAAHIMARHPAERLSQELAVKVGVSAAQALLTGDGGNSGLVAGALGIGATVGVLLPYSRKHELEADRIGVELMRQVGMNPEAAIGFWRRMAASGDRQAAPLELLSTHPADDRRLAALQEAVAGTA